MNAITLMFEEGMLSKMGLADAVQVLKRKGFPMVTASGRDLSHLIKGEGECWLSFGSIAFIRQAMRTLPHTPVAYYSDTRFNQSFYAHRLPQGSFLNDLGFFMPCASLPVSLKAIERAFGGDRIFIRPDSGAKPFTGFDVAYRDVDDELKALKAVTGLTDSMMLHVCPFKEIQAEFRFFIVNRKVIDGSYYSYEQDEAVPIPAGAWALAERIAEHPWQIDIAYSCDVGMTSEGARVVELNAGCTSGFYRADAARIIEAMIETALLEHQGELTIED